MNFPFGLGWALPSKSWHEHYYLQMLQGIKRHASKSFQSMAPHGHRAGPSKDATPIRRARARAPVINTHEEGESFDLDDISSSDDDSGNDNYISGDDPNAIAHPTPADHPCEGDRATLAQEAHVRVNDPTLPLAKKSTAADIHYFYERSGDQMVCVECK